MVEYKGKKALGIFLIALGAFFLLLNSGLLWFGWGVVWPLFPLLAGVLVMRFYAVSRRPGELLLGLVLTQLGLFFFVFTVGAVPWSAMSMLWPFLILVPGMACLAVAVTGRQRVSALIVGLVAIAVSVAGFWAGLEGAGSGVLTPLVRLWPVTLVVAGIMIYMRARRVALDAGELHRGSGDPTDPQRASPTGSRGRL